MIKLILVFLLFLLSLLVLFRAPANLLWYMAILVSEFSWVFILLVSVVVFIPVASRIINLVSLLMGLATIGILLVPYWQAWRLARALPISFEKAFGTKFIAPSPFNIARVFTGIGARKRTFRSFSFDTSHGLTLNFYRAAVPGVRPCVVVIHGGSWSAGDNQQLPELNSELAYTGYHVASINYRLAPAFHFPAPVEDVQAALRFLKKTGRRSGNRQHPVCAAWP